MNITNVRCYLQISNIGCCLQNMFYNLMFNSFYVNVFFCNTGVVACLFWNIIAVSAAWIKGEGVLFFCKFQLHVLFIFIKLIPVTFDVTCCIFRCKDMVSGHYILFSWCTWWICAVVSPSLQCYEVGNFFTIHQKIV